MTKHPVAHDLALGAPPVAYAGAAFAGLSLPDWAALLAIIYTTATGTTGLHPPH